MIAFKPDGTPLGLLAAVFGAGAAPRVHAGAGDSAIIIPPVRGSARTRWMSLSSSSLIAMRRP